VKESLLPVAHVLGRLLLVFSVAYLGPIACSIAFHDGLAGDFGVAMVLTVGIGALLIFGTRRWHRELKARDGFLLVTLAWILMASTAALPLMIVYTDMSFTDAFFECMSAMTTTGATVLSGLDNAPQSINLWRHLLQWLGGLGIIVLAVAILPLLGVGGMQLYKAETPGPMKDSRLTERIADTAKALWMVYVALTLACMLSLRVAGMSWFDSLCHAFSAMSLGGFSTRDASIGAFDSPAIEAVLMAFMILAGINFATHFTAFRERRVACYLVDLEARAFVVVVAASCLGIALFLAWTGVYPDFWVALRHASFNTVSLATTSGYASVDYDRWPVFAALWILFLSGFAASSGSTGGGIKMVRTLILYKQARRELLKLLHPSVADLIKVGNSMVPNKVAFSVLGFIFLYFLTAAVMTFLLLASGMDFVSGFSAVIACINNAGPGLGKVGPAQNYGSLTDFQTWVCAATMLLGRLEIMSVVVIFTPQFWRK
jgi:trk system potassium uptake protein